MDSRPTAAPNHFPYAHRTLAEVRRDEEWISLWEHVQRFQPLKRGQLRELNELKAKRIP